MASSILIADDDSHIRDVIRFALQDAGYQTREAENGVQAVQSFAQTPADLVILDIGMPEMNGFETCRTLRQKSSVPILFLTARADEIDRVLAFELGGDDYVSKPFSPRELVLRVRAILKRGKTVDTSEALVVADLKLYAQRHTATLKGQALDLTAREFSLLETLAKSPERVFPKALVMTHVYGENIYVSDRTLDSHVRNLRAKARALGCDNLISTVHGVGLKLGHCQC